MTNTAKILLSVGGFIICAAAGYFGTGIIRDALSQDSRPASLSSSGGGASGGGGGSFHGGSIGGNSTPAPSNPEPQPDASPETTAPADLAPSIVSVSAPQKGNDGKTYSFTVVASGTGLSYHLTDASMTEIGQPQPNGSFVVPATTSGVYNVYVTDSSGRKSEYHKVTGCTSVPEVRRIEASELQTIINSGDAGKASDADFKNRVLPGCRYTFEGLNSDEPLPQSYNDMILRVNMGTWQSVQVLSVSYTPEGRMSSARIKVNY